ncbi:ribokinase [Paenibacillus tyrfis]|uniref:ribokinase n=1 Tax=Paenibacillus tyrfis TaxID=1501230 RepID=UPI00209DD8E8|nr:ribokinase [Paenibacillus tyrfis]MCP1312436.1 ribokinase [Paenibacillus tyrfis]
MSSAIEVVVVGSLNMDLSVTVKQKPDRGETVLGGEFLNSPGGKGANQAYAAQRIGAQVAMVGKIGADLFGEHMVNNLAETGVDTQFIDRVQGTASGVALISLDQDGDNSIIVAPGANQMLSAIDIREHEDLIRSAKLLMVQMEIPYGAVLEAVKIARNANVPVLLDPAPANSVTEELLQMVDYITPNEGELSQLTGHQVEGLDSIKLSARQLLSYGIRTVFAKLGADGVYVIRSDEERVIPGYKVVTQDTTAAGDAFAGALAASLVAGIDDWEAAKIANAVGALTVTRRGAQASIPNLEALQIFMEEYQSKYSKRFGGMADA